MIISKIIVYDRCFLFRFFLVRFGTELDGIQTANDVARPGQEPDDE